MRSAFVVVAVCASVAAASVLDPKARRPFQPPNATWSCGDAPACGTSMACYNGCCAYSNGPDDQCTGNSCNGVGAYGYQFQCVELAQRCFSQWYGTTKIWYDNANTMCSNYPSGVQQTSSPAPGDMMVFSWAPYGHVTVITAVNGDSISVIEQNSSPTGQNVYQRGSEECFLTPSKRGMCTGVPDGWYCGGDMIAGGSPNTLYYCAEGSMTTSKSCSGEVCTVVPQANDVCVAGSCTGSMPNGWYCGDDGIQGGQADVLYFCSGGTATTAKECGNGCHVAPTGQNDYCN
jgi:surface antigen